jgi:DNA-binding transcriptional regulator LsrR (DeoR family)
LLRMETGTELTVVGGAVSQDRELLARLAHRYYRDELTQEQVAAEFGMSRQKVQRLLDRARRVGVVDFRINAPADLRLDLESELRSSFDLDDAVVVAVRAGGSPRDAVAHAAAEFLARVLRPGSVVAVGMGRNAGAVAPFFRPARRLECTFVAAMGGSPTVDAPINPNETCRALAERSGGHAEAVYAPAYVDSAETRDRLVEEPTVGHSLRIATGADLYLVGIGDTDDDCTMVRSGCMPLEEMARLRRRGAVGDLLCNYFDVDGRVIDSEIYRRLIGLGLGDLRGEGMVVAVASEPQKSRAVLGALRTGVVDVLIVDEINARAALTAAGGDDEREEALHA